MAHSTCVVVFGNGVRCKRRASRVTGLCKDCSRWAHKHGKSPQGRPHKRGNGELRALLEAAARAITRECIIVDHKRRPLAGHNGVMIPAARLVWIIANGDPGKLHVLHRCHRGDDGCVNINCLYLGPHARNMRDMAEAERSARGERHGIAKLTREQVRDIRRRYVKGARYPHPGNSRVLAEEFGLHPAYIRELCRNERWAWLGAEES